jgi:hypothetical protein
VESYEYRSNVLGVFHALLATFLSFYCIFYACENGENFFNSKECADNPRNITIFTAIFSGSYFLVDLILLVFYTKCETVMHKQYVIHHVIGWTLLTLPLITHDYFTCASVAFMIIEVSGAFPNLRYLLFQHGFKNGDRVMTANSLMLAFTFLFGRMPLLIILIVLSAGSEIFSVFLKPDTYGWIYKTFVALEAVMVLSLFALNIYWAYAMVRMITKVMKGGSMPSETANPDTKDDEFVRADLNKSAEFGKTNE